MAAAIGVSMNGLIGMEARGLPIHKKGRGSTDPNQYLLRDVVEWLVQDRERRGSGYGIGTLDLEADYAGVECDLPDGSLDVDEVMVITITAIGRHLWKCMDERKQLTKADFMLAFAFVAFCFLEGVGCSNEEYLQQVLQVGKPPKVTHG